MQDSLPFIDLLCQGLCAFTDDAQRVRSFTCFPHFKIPIENAGWYEGAFVALGVFGS